MYSGIDDPRHWAFAQLGKESAEMAGDRVAITITTGEQLSRHLRRLDHPRPFR